MTAREYLDSVARANKRVKMKVGEVEELRKMACSLNSPDFGERGTGMSARRAPYENMVFKIMEMEDEVSREAASLVDLKFEALEKLLLLDDTRDIEILQKRYLDGYSWAQLQESLNLSQSTLYRLHHEALERLDQKLGGTA